MTNELKVGFCVLAYLLSECDFLPAIQGLSFRNMWVLLLKALPRTRLFPSPIVVSPAGKLAILSEEEVELVASMLYYRDEANLKKTIGAPEKIIASVRGDASGYTDVIRCVLWSIHGKNAGNSGLPTTNIRWKLARADAVLDMRQRGFRKPIPWVDSRG